MSIKIGNPSENDLRILQVPLVLKSDQNCDLQTAARCLRYRGAQRCFQGGGSLVRIATEFRIFFNIDEHLTSCLRMDNLLSIIENENIQN